MPITKRHRFVHAHIAWMLATAFVLALVDSLTYELFFVASLVGFLLVAELTAPFRVTPTWRRRLRWVTFAGLVGFALILMQRVIDVLPAGAL